METIEIIEQYILEQLPAAEKAAFEAQLARSPELQEQVAQQRAILQGIDRAILRQKAQQAGRRFRLRRNFLKGGSAGLVVVVVVAAMLFKRTEVVPSAYSGTNLPTYNEAGTKDWVDADKNLPAQVFSLNTDRDTVIETKKGIVVSIPAQSFLDADGRHVDGKIQLVIKEAMDPSTIIRAGLSTRSGDQLLETGGMFFVDARKDGRPLKINPASAIFAEVPADTVKPGMHVYQGVRKTDGTIDWTAPRPLNHDLVPVDIRTLDFYPPHYLDSLGKWGYNRYDRKFTDSLYFSLAAEYGEEPTVTANDATNKTDTFVSIKFNCGLDPAKVRAVWDTKFQNTILSTREFEARMPLLHKAAEGQLLDLYVKNLDRDLSDIDSIAAQSEGGVKYKKEFLAFYSHHDGKVAGASKKMAKLREYYEMKSQIYRQAAIKTQAEFWDKQDILDSIAGNKTLQHQNANSRRLAENFKQELELNLKNAYGQLGYDTSIVLRPPTLYNYSVPITTTGWYNIDRAVMESTVTRTSLNYTDAQTGKKATIAYAQVTLTVSHREQYDRCNVYLLPNRLSSFMRLADSNGHYSEKLNQLMKYRLVCIGYRDDRVFWYSLDSLQAKTYPSLVLTEIGKNELSARLNADLKAEAEFDQFDIKNGRRRKDNDNRRELKDKVIQFVFPCYISSPVSVNVSAIFEMPGQK